MSDQQFGEMWEGALARFKVATGKNLEDESLAKPSSLENLIQAIEERHGQFAAYCERGATLRKYIKLSLAPVVMLGDLAAGGASTVGSSQRVTWGRGRITLYRYFRPAK